MAAFTGTYNRRHLNRLFEGWGGEVPPDLKDRVEARLPYGFTCERAVITPLGRADAAGDPLYTVEYHDPRPAVDRARVVN